MLSLTLVLIAPLPHPNPLTLLELLPRSDDRTEQALLKRRTFVLACSQEVKTPFLHDVLTQEERQKEIENYDRFFTSLDSFCQPGMSLSRINSTNDCLCEILPLTSIPPIISMYNNTHLSVCYFYQCIVVYPLDRYRRYHCATTDAHITSAQACRHAERYCSRHVFPAAA